MGLPSNVKNVVRRATSQAIISASSDGTVTVEVDATQSHYKAYVFCSGGTCDAYFQAWLNVARKVLASDKLTGVTDGLIYLDGGPFAGGLEVKIENNTGTVTVDLELDDRV